MIRDKVACDTPERAANARWLSSAAARARSINTPTFDADIAPSTCVNHTTYY
jgi:hypothetical protein